MSQLVGVHTGQDDPITYATEVGADVVQIFLGDPQSWSSPSVKYDGGAAGLAEAAAEAGVGIVVHAPYVLNVATTNNRIRIPSRKLLQKTMTLAGEVGALGVVVHGGHVTAKDDPEVGYDNWRKAIEQTDKPVPMLIENTAGGANSMARGLAKITRLWETVAATGDDQVGLCLDTAHAFAGGDELPGLAEKVLEVTGRIDVVHLNNSQGAFDSGVDRHAGLQSEAGLIAPADLAALAAASGATIVMETPGDEHPDEVAWLRQQL